MGSNKCPDIDELLKNGHNKTDLEVSTNVIVFVGKTGAGKSTLSKFMCRDESLTVSSNEQGMFIFSDNDTTIGSTNCLESKTFYPNIVKDPMTGSLIIDCAGFEDTRSREFDLTAAYMNKNILDSAEKMKIVLVENYSNLILGNDRTAFINNLKHASALIKDNIDSFENSICLIATKVRSNHENKQVEKAIKIFLRKTLKHITDLKDQATNQNEKEELCRQIKILDFIEEAEHFSYFREPTEKKSPWEQDGLKENYDKIRCLVFEELKCSTQFKNKFHVAVAPDTINYVIKTVLPDAMEKNTKIIKQAQEFFVRHMEQKLRTGGKIEEKCLFVVDYCDNVKESITKIEAFNDIEILFDLFEVDKSLWDELKFQNKKLRFLHGIAKNNLEEFEKDAAGLFGCKESIVAHVNNTARFHSFMKNLRNDDQTYCSQLWNSNGSRIDVDSFKSFHALLPERGFNEETISSAVDLIPNEDLVTDLNDLLKACTPKYPDIRTVDNTMIFSGQCIVLSQIAPAIKSQNNVIHTIAIKAVKTLYVDCDIKLQNTHLVIMAPQVIVHEKQRTFYLSGEDGALHSYENADEDQEAQHGNPGFSSGSFRLFADNVKNASLLLVQSVGGNGSDGQNGCAGKIAKSPPTPNLSTRYEGDLGSITKKMESPGYKVYVTDKGESSGKGPELNLLTVPIMIIGAPFISHEKHDQKEIWVVNEKNSIAPTDGRCGGNAGTGATAGEIHIEEKLNEEIVCETQNGKSGKRGSGGKGGATAANKSYKVYQCKGTKSTTMFSSGGAYQYVATEEMRDVECKDKFPEARCGKDGAANVSPILNYKFEMLLKEELDEEQGIQMMAELDIIDK